MDVSWARGGEGEGEGESGNLCVSSGGWLPDGGTFGSAADDDEANLARRGSRKLFSRAHRRQVIIVTPSSASAEWSLVSVFWFSA